MAMEPVKLGGETYIDKATVDRLIEQYLRSEGAITNDCVVVEIVGDTGPHGEDPVMGFTVRVERDPKAAK